MIERGAQASESAGRRQRRVFGRCADQAPPRAEGGRETEPETNWPTSARNATLNPRRVHRGSGTAFMKTRNKITMTALLVVVLSAAASIWWHSSRKCGLMPWEWSRYYTRAVRAVDDPELWRQFNRTRPVDRIGPRSRMFGCTDDCQHPTWVEVHVPIAQPTTNNFFIVEFDHPSGKIRDIRAANVIF